VFGHVAHGFAGALVDHTRPDRNFNRHVFTAFTGTVTALAVLATFSAEGFFKTVVDQVLRFSSASSQTSPPSPPSPPSGPPRDIFFTAEAHATIAAITCHDQDRCFINKLHFTLRNSFA
jgi:hypothetical protein